jgi:catechol 2,3-dioxygenase-like lactoylglutathione lyase family enzyme
MSRVQLALRVSDLAGSVAFYAKLFGAEPAKRRPGYANFAIGVEVATTDDVNAATTRLTDAGLVTLTEDDTECCYALQDKVWVHGPGQEPWEVYVVKGDADQLNKTSDGGPCVCGDPDTADAETAASGCC